MIKDITSAEVSKVIINEDENCVELIVAEDQLILAIGKKRSECKISIRACWLENRNTKYSARIREAQQRAQPMFSFICWSFKFRRDYGSAAGNRRFLTVEDISNASIKELASIEGNIVGCYVSDRVIKRDSLIKVVRNGKLVHEGKLKARRRFKYDVEEVGTNFECGVLVEGNIDIKVGYILEAYQLVQEERVL